MNTSALKIIQAGNNLCLLLWFREGWELNLIIVSAALVRLGCYLHPKVGDDLSVLPPEGTDRLPATAHSKVTRAGQEG